MRSISRSRRVSRRVRWLAAELLIVFLGVSAAFGLDRYRTQVDNDRRERLIYEALLAQSRELQQELGQHAVRFDSVYVRAFFEAYDRGEMPKLQPLRLGGGSMGAMWSALLQAGGIDVLEPAFIREVETNLSWHRFDQLQRERLTSLSDAYLLPNLSRHPDAFYDPSTRLLREEYHWYAEGLLSIARLNGTVDSLNLELQRTLESRLNGNR